MGVPLNLHFLDPTEHLLNSSSLFSSTVAIEISYHVYAIKSAAKLNFVDAVRAFSDPVIVPCMSPSLLL